MTFELRKNKIMKILLPILTTLFLVVLIPGTQAQEIYKYASHSMTISGTSSLHDWESDATKMSGSATITMDAGKIKGISWMQISIPVKAITSTHGSIMDGKTHDALKADANPDIIFKLKSISTISAGSQNYTISAKGTLSMAGQTREISLTVTAQTDSSGAITFKGTKALKMSDFGISPPTAMLGTLKTGDDITLDFTLKLSK